MQEKLIELIKNYSQTNCSINGDSRLHEDIGLSSLKMLMLIADIEEAFHCKIEWDSLINVKTVSQLAQAIHAK